MTVGNIWRGQTQTFKTIQEIGSNIYAFMSCAIWGLHCIFVVVDVLQQNPRISGKLHDSLALYLIQTPV